MSSVVIAGDTSGAITLAAPAVAGSNTLTLPAATGTILVPGNASALTSGTAQTLSGSAVEYTGIPSWVKRITWSVSGLSLTGSASPSFQLGTSGGYATSGYTSFSCYFGATNASGSNTNTSGFIIATGAAANLHYGNVVLTYVGSNLWVCTGLVSINGSGTYYTFSVNGSITLGGTLDRVRVTNNGSDTFDAGTVNIIYE